MVVFQPYLNESRYVHETRMAKYCDVCPHIRSLAPIVVLNNSCYLTHNAKREVLPCQVDSFALLYLNTAN